jgi:hypothetical protein
MSFKPDKTVIALAREVAQHHLASGNDYLLTWPVPLEFLFYTVFLASASAVHDYASLCA